MSDPGMEVAKEFAGAAGKEFARPGADLMANIIGVLGGDALKEFRERQRMRREDRHKALGNDALRILKDRGVKQPAEPNAAAVDQLALAAQDEPREDLRRLWASLLAGMFDPSRAPFFRREFIDIAKQLEPIDALVLPLLRDSAGMSPDRRAFVAQRLSRSEDEIEVAFRNLRKLELIDPRPAGGNDQNFPLPSALGKQFLLAAA